MNDLTLTARKRLGNGLEDLINNQPWMQDASCAGLSPELADAMFFPANGKVSPGTAALCGVCPVRSDCLQFAVTDSLGHGVWGGEFGSHLYIEPALVARAEEAA